MKNLMRSLIVVVAVVSMTSVSVYAESTDDVEIGITNNTVGFEELEKQCTQDHGAANSIHKFLDYVTLQHNVDVDNLAYSADVQVAAATGAHSNIAWKTSQRNVDLDNDRFGGDIQFTDSVCFHDTSAGQELQRTVDIDQARWIEETQITALVCPLNYCATDFTVSSR